MQGKMLKERDIGPAGDRRSAMLPSWNRPRRPACAAGR